MNKEPVKYYDVELPCGGGVWKRVTWEWISWKNLSYYDVLCDLLPGQKYLLLPPHKKEEK